MRVSADESIESEERANVGGLFAGGSRAPDAAGRDRPLGPGAKGRAGRPATAGTDQEFARLVREWTTRPEFLSPLVDHLPTARGVPSPKDVLGYHIGQPKRLTYYADMLKCYRALAAASPLITRIRDNVIVSITPSAEPDGRDRYVDWYYAYKTGETGESVSYGGPPY